MIWWIDAQAGASGDMLLGALLALDPEGLAHAQHAVDAALIQLGAEPVTLTCEPTRRAGLAAIRAPVVAKVQEVALTPSHGLLLPGWDKPFGY